MSSSDRRTRVRVRRAIAVFGALACAVTMTAWPSVAFGVAAGPGVGFASAGPMQTAGQGGALETAATRAGDTGRKVAFSLIGLALAVAAVILVFKRDFKEAVGVFAVGILAVLLASPAGISVLRGTVSSLFG